MQDETYLGDGLYASFGFGTVRLRAPRDDGTNHIVYLDDSTYAALRKFARTIGLEAKEAGSE